MPNTVIQIKRSTVTTAPTAGSLSAAEPAYSYLSDKLFLGSSDGSQVIEIGGKYYVNVAIQAYDAANTANDRAVAAFNKANSIMSAGGLTAFSNIAIGGTFLVADSNADVLTIQSSNGISLVADAAQDSFNIGLTLTGVTSGTYGAGDTVVPTFTVDPYGRITLAGNVTITNAAAVAVGANAYATAVGAGSNNYLLAVIAGANTAVGAGANAFASATIAGANSAVGAGANSYATAVGAGSNNYLLAVIAGANTAVGAGANAFASATIAGANTAVGAGANAFASATIAGANTAVGAGANNYANGTFVKLVAGNQTITGNLAITGSLTVSGNAFTIDTETLRVSDPLIYLASNNYVSDIVDIGFVANYVNATGQNVHTGIFRDATIKEYYVFEGYNQEPIPNHIDTSANGFTLAVLNAVIKTSNLILGGANAILTINSVGTAANGFASATIAGANAAVGAGANSYATAVGAGSNNYLLAVIAGANTAVGAGANAFASATIAGANTAVGTAANNFAIATFGAANNTPVGNTIGGGFTLRATRRGLNFVPGTNITINVDDDSAGNRANITIDTTGLVTTATLNGTNTYFSNVYSTIAGANTAVGAGANAFASATIAGANTAVGAGANSYATAVGAAANTNAANGTYITTGIVGVSVGGTGRTTFANNGVLFGNTTGGIRVTSAGTEGNVLQVNNQGTPFFGMLDGGSF